MSSHPRGFHHLNVMDNKEVFTYLCDELIAEILCRIENPLDQRSISLVCKRWLTVQRSSKKKLSLCIPRDSLGYSFCSSILPFLKQHPYLICLSIVSKDLFSNTLLSKVVKAVASACKSLRHFQFTAGSITMSGLQELSKGCPFLASLTLLQPPSPCLSVLAEFKTLNELCLTGCLEEIAEDMDCVAYGSLRLERLSLMDLRPFSSALQWLWHSCNDLKKLELWGCEAMGSMDIISLPCWHSLREVQLERCRSIAGNMLMLLAEHCPDLRSLTIHDGADTEGLRYFLRRCKALEVLELRLPLDLSNEDLVEIAQNCRSLRSLRLQSCWLATGAGMQLLASLIKSDLEELVLVRCRAVVQDTGTLSVLGQYLIGLRKIDLSDNEGLVDKELAAMLASCENVVQLKLWKCCTLTDRVLDFIGQRCPMLESIDIWKCDGISKDAVCNLLLHCNHLRKIGVEFTKLTNLAKKLAFKKGIKFIGAGKLTELQDHSCYILKP